jgi:hypothetical protein
MVRLATEDEGFHNNPNLKRSNVSYEFTSEQIEEFTKCSLDIMHFVTTYIKIVHPDPSRGLINFEPYEFQKDFIKKITDNRFVIAKLSRQAGKTTTTVAAILWHIIFNANFSVGVLANKSAQANEILKRIKLAYENLPKWLQQGVVKWGEKTILLENGSSVIASATSSSSIRGQSLSMLYLDEFAHINMRVQNEFYQSSYPAISAGNETKIIITSTPYGMNLFYQIWRDALESKNDFVTLEAHWSQIPGRDEEWRKKTIKNIGGIQKFREEYETEFVGSMATLISASKLLELRAAEPVSSSDVLNVYKYALPGNVYTAIVDTSRGIERDYSTIVVVDITKVPYEVVAVYRSNTVTPMMFPSHIEDVCSKYNNCFVMIEANKIDTIPYILQKELEYENIFHTLYDTQKKYKKISFAAGTLGVEIDKRIKRIGCLNLRDLVETNNIILNDDNLINELCQFIQVKESFQADPDSDATDDIVMPLVIFGWMLTDNVYKEFLDHDLREKLLENLNTKIEASVLPLPIHLLPVPDASVPTLSNNIFEKWVRGELDTENDNGEAFQHFFYPL